MSLWDEYQNRISAHGGTKRSAMVNREVHFLNQNIKNGMSYHQVLIDGAQRDVSIISSDVVNKKKILSLPGEDIKCGALVEWNDNYWLVVEKDADSEIYTKANIVQCNHLLKWVDENDDVREQWCVIEDGAKYSVGESEGGNFVITRGDSRISMTIAKNEHTVKFGRESRFLIDDNDVGEKLSYLITKPLKVGRPYNGEGVYFFILQEVVSTEDDNMQLGIADFYKHFEKPLEPVNVMSNLESAENADTHERRVWL